METLTGFNGLTTIEIAFDVAGLFETQMVLEEIRTHETASPLVGI